MAEVVTFEKAWATIQENSLKWEKQHEKDVQERKENERILNEKFAETERFLKSVGQKLADIGFNNGCCAEEYFYNSFEKDLRFAHERFDQVERNIKGFTKNIRDEFDIVLYNGKSIAIVEVKYKAHKTDIEKTLKKVRTFKSLFPIYAEYKYYLGLAFFFLVRYNKQLS